MHQDNSTLDIFLNIRAQNRINLLLRRIRLLGKCLFVLKLKLCLTTFISNLYYFRYFHANFNFLFSKGC